MYLWVFMLCTINLYYSSTSSLLSLYYLLYILGFPSSNRKTQMMMCHLCISLLFPLEFILFTKHNHITIILIDYIIVYYIRLWSKMGPYGLPIWPLKQRVGQCTVSVIQQCTGFSFNNQFIVLQYCCSLSKHFKVNGCYKEQQHHK